MADKKNLFPEYPTLEQGSYAEDVDKSIKDAEARMARQEARAKRDRDMAIIGDLAGVIAQGGAMHGGAWKIDKTNSATAQGNEKLKALQERNIAQVAEFAKQRAALRDAKRKEENAQKVAQYNAEVERYKRDQTDAYNQARLDEQKRHNEAMEEYYGIRENRLDKQGGSGGSGKDSYPMEVNGVKFDANNDNDVARAYNELLGKGMAKAQKVDRRYEAGSYGDGKWVTSDPYDLEYPTTEQMLNQILWYKNQVGNQVKNLGFSSNNSKQLTMK